MRKALLFAFVFVLFIGGYAIGRRHHVGKPPGVTIEEGAVDLLINEKESTTPPEYASITNPTAVMHVSYSPEAAQTQTQPHDPNHAVPIPGKKFLTRYHEVRKKFEDSQADSVTVIDTWSTFVPGKKVRITFNLSQNLDNDTILIEAIKNK
jgi:hypothetical protein